MVVTFCAFYGLVFLPIIRNRRNPLLFLGKLGVQSLMVAAFAGGFYLTFKLLEPKMAARKKLLVATLGIVLLPASVFALTYTPTLSIAELFRQSSPPGPPKPYEEAIYDVYSGLLNGEMTQRSLGSERESVDTCILRGFLKGAYLRSADPQTTNSCQNGR